tara:strand:+ start:701 stop:1267 length:567 start_codon:yes stop_codon:yes gene_type:complete
VDYLQFCLDWWAKGGLVNFVILGSSFFVGLFYLSNKFSKGFVNIMIGVVPLLGLLGTVVGMIQTFNALQNTGTDVQSLAGGISKAMITTSSGLCVAIFGTIFLPLKKPEKLDNYESFDDLTIEQLEEIVSQKTFVQKLIKNIPQITIKSKWIKKYLKLKKSFNKAYKNVWIKVQPECKQERPSFISFF